MDCKIQQLTYNCQHLLLASQQQPFYPTAMNLGKRLQLAREKRGRMTQAQLAEKCPGASQAMISALEQRDSKTSELIFAFADALKINPRWLQTGLGDSGLDAPEWKPSGMMGSDETRLLDDYRHAVERWKLSLRLLASLPGDHQEQIAGSVNALLATVFPRRAPDRAVEEAYGLPPDPRHAAAQ